MISESQQSEGEAEAATHPPPLTYPEELSMWLRIAGIVEGAKAVRTYVRSAIVALS